MGGGSSTVVLGLLLPTDVVRYLMSLDLVNSSALTSTATAATVVAHPVEELAAAVGPVAVAPATDPVEEDDNNNFLGILRACKRMVRSDDMLAT